MTEPSTKPDDHDPHAASVASALPDLLKGGGASDLLGKLTSSGLGDLAKSWVSKGANLPISVDQIKGLLGSGPIASIAGKLGISTEQATFSLARALPHAIDHMTPDGEPPGADAAAPDPAAVVAKMFGR